MIPYLHAKELLLARAGAVRPVMLPLDQAAGRVAAAPVAAAFPVPSFHNSAMDGFALAADAAAGAKPEQPLRLPVAAVAAAGGGPALWRPGAVVQIMTGAALPPGPDTVVPIENVTVERGGDGVAQAITLTAPLRPGSHIRRQGEDFAVGDPLLAAGERITPHQIMALAALGVGRVMVAAAPLLTVLATGDEVRPVTADHDGAPPGGDAIFNANSPYLLAAAGLWGAETEDGGQVPDTRAAFAQALRGLMARNRPGRVVLSTGAVSKGEFDFVPDALADVGAEILFHRAAIRPGKPILFALLPGGIPFFGLPGNPISAAVGFRFFVVPLLRARLGLPPEMPWRLPLARPHAVKPGYTVFLKAALSIGGGGTPRVEILPGQESFRIRPMLAANGWVAWGESCSELESGHLVDFYPAFPQTVA
ncbi:molybdopterin molybdenumtransferase [mine drainage metagenome]|uniref:Molybdopterin molybdenumtransferase n=1 Tax=mine drainage metagenome TaxID=410659 RepID=A0A1J5SJY3_9ZZZZ